MWLVFFLFYRCHLLSSFFFILQELHMPNGLFSLMFTLIIRKFGHMTSIWIQTLHKTKGYRTFCPMVCLNCICSLDELHPVTCACTFNGYFCMYTSDLRSHVIEKNILVAKLKVITGYHWNTTVFNKNS